MKSNKRYTNANFTKRVDRDPGRHHTSGHQPNRRNVPCAEQSMLADLSWQRD